MSHNMIDVDFPVKSSSIYTLIIHLSISSITTQMKSNVSIWRPGDIAQLVGACLACVNPCVSFQCYKTNQPTNK